MSGVMQPANRSPDPLVDGRMMLAVKGCIMLQFLTMVF